jgi:hypothetical protein
MFETVPIILENELLQIEIQKPGIPYKGSRFDWTGQIIQITYLNKHTLCTTELIGGQKINECGRGLYNEFGLDEPIGYNDCRVGNTFPKIGVGLLEKDSEDEYDFSKKYKINPYSIRYSVEKTKAQFICETEKGQDYSFRLEKNIELNKNSFTIYYSLFNSGKKTINTNEYVHNFLSINNRLIDGGYNLAFPFQLQPEQFGYIVDPENVFNFQNDSLTWNSVPSIPFFISKANADYLGKGSWTLFNLEDNVGIQETADFNIQKINLWGNSHVVSPELYIKIIVPPGKKMSWSRTYSILSLK